MRWTLTESPLMQEAVVWMVGTDDGATLYDILNECRRFIVEELGRSVEGCRWADQRTCRLFTTDQSVFTLSFSDRQSQKTTSNAPSLE